jgi:hypothetical protein
MGGDVMSKEPYRDNWSQIEVRVPLYEELKAEAEVQGCSMGKLIEAYADVYKHLMMPERMLIEHLKKYHPEAVHEYESGSDEDMANMEKEHDAQVEYRQKVEATIWKHRRGMRIHRIIAGKKAAENRTKKAEVEA